MHGVSTGYNGTISWAFSVKLLYLSGLMTRLVLYVLLLWYTKTLFFKSKSSVLLSFWAHSLIWSSCRRSPGPEWRVVLRFGWATTDFYIPPMHPDKHRQYRALIQEALPRCLNVRVGGRLVNLPDPIFHGGQAQRLGKRLRLSIDITDRVSCFVCGLSWRFACCGTTRSP